MTSRSTADPPWAVSRPFAALALAIAIAAALVGFVLRAAGPRTIGRAMAPDGTEMRLVQQFNWGFEPFTTSFVFRPPGGTWGRFYYDHEDDFWRYSPAVVDTARGVAVFYRGGQPAVTFDWRTATFTLHRFQRTLTGAQWQMSADWNPDRPVY